MIKIIRILLSVKMTILLSLAIALPLAAPGLAQDAQTANFPDRPITFIHPLPAGGTTDMLTRLLSKEAEKDLGQPIVILNKPGGSLTIGAAAIAASKPDGYTIGFTGATALFIMPFMEKLSYDPIKDFHQIIQWGAPSFGVTVRADSPFKNFKDVVSYARANPNKLNWGTTGQIGLHYLIMKQIAQKENVQFTQIPFKGGPLVEVALLGGHIDVAGSEFSNAQLEAGKTRLLLLLREERAAEYPNTPALNDLGYSGVAVPMIQGIAGPRGIPDEIAKKLEAAFTKAMKQPAFIKGMKDAGYSVLYRSGKDSSDYIAKNHKFFEKYLKELGLTK